MRSGTSTNCHLHFDHCGGNPELPGRPVFTQRTELDLARNVEDHTLPELIDAPGISYTELDGETEILPGVRIVPTPGHTAGHQSVVVRRARRLGDRGRPEPRQRDRLHRPTCSGGGGRGGRSQPAWIEAELRSARVDSDSGSRALRGPRQRRCWTP